MKIAFPITKDASGAEFASIEAIQEHFANELNGHFLLGKNDQWHGGVHITEKNSQHCVKDQPVRAIADGKVVAYRMNTALLESEFPVTIPDKKLEYSTNFCLIQHDYEAINSKGDTPKSNKLKFYSLYMHLAPPVFAEEECYEVKPEKILRARSVLLGEQTEGEEEGTDLFYDPTSGYVELLEGSIVKKLDESLAKRNVVNKDDTAKKYDFHRVEVVFSGRSNIEAGTQCWLYLNDSAITSCQWAGKGLEWLPQESTEVTVLEGDSQIEIEAGDGVGFLGDYEYPVKDAAGAYSTSVMKQVHLEVFTDDDAGLDAVLNNTAEIEQEFIYFVEAGKPLYIKSLTHKVAKVITSNGVVSRQEPTAATADSNGLKVRNETTGATVAQNALFAFAPDTEINVYYPDYAPSLPTVKGRISLGNDSVDDLWFCIKDGFIESFPKFDSGSESMVSIERQFESDEIVLDADGETQWLKYDANNKWIKSTDVTAISRHDLAERGYKTLDLFEDNYEKILLEGEEEGVKELFKSLCAEIDIDGDRELSPEEIKEAHKNPEIRKSLHKLIVKSTSEWYQPDNVSTSIAKYYQGFIEKGDADDATEINKQGKEIAEHELDRALALEWLNEASEKGLMIGPRVWHISPFLVGNFNPLKIKITLEMLRKIWKSTDKVSDEYLTDVVNEVNTVAEEVGLNSVLRLNHFFAQSFSEVGTSFTLEEDLLYKVSVLKDKFSYYKQSDSHKAEADVDGFGANPMTSLTREERYDKYEVIANKIYGSHREGTKYALGNTVYGDGWKYRGRGLIQLTGKENYQKITDCYKVMWPNDSVNFISNPDLLLEVKYAVRSALAYYVVKKVWDVADLGGEDDNVKDVTNKINDGLEEEKKAERIDSFKDFIDRNVFNEIA